MQSKQYTNNPLLSHYYSQRHIYPYNADKETAPFSCWQQHNPQNNTRPQRHPRNQVAQLDNNTNALAFPGKWFPEDRVLWEVVLVDSEQAAVLVASEQAVV